jgi:hypothetical protein
MGYVGTTSIAAMISAGLHLAAPGAMAASPSSAAAKIETIDGTKIKRVTLTEKAAQRLDIKTAEIREDPTGKKIMPYASVFYDLAGDAWVYTTAAPRVFVRQKVAIELVKGNDAYLKDGPPVGTQVVTVGVSELYGAEFGVGH